MWEKYWVIFLGVGNQSEFFTLKLMVISFSTYEFFTLRTVFIERITFVNRGMDVSHLREKNYCIFNDTPKARYTDANETYVVQIQFHYSCFNIICSEPLFLGGSGRSIPQLTQFSWCRKLPNTLFLGHRSPGNPGGKVSLLLYHYGTRPMHIQITVVLALRKWHNTKEQETADTC
jgi:hypothetical protein